MGNSVMLNGVEYAGEQIAYKDSTYEPVSYTHLMCIRDRGIGNHAGQLLQCPRSCDDRPSCVLWNACG